MGARSWARIKERTGRCPALRATDRWILQCNMIYQAQFHEVPGDFR
jgi:hypothetical protein